MYKHIQYVKSAEQKNSKKYSHFSQYEEISSILLTEINQKVKFPYSMKI